nr:S-layer homology domain-containing protein [bacterium]
MSRKLLAVLAFILGMTGGVLVAQPVRTFTDVPEDHWAHEAVQWAVANGITTGKSDTEFGVDDPLTRGQAVVLLHRAIEEKPAPARTASDVFSGTGNAVAGPVMLEEGRYLVTVTGATYVYVYSDGAVEDWDHCDVLTSGGLLGQESIMVVSDEPSDWRPYQCPAGLAWLEVRATSGEWEIRFVRLNRPAS